MHWAKYTCVLISGVIEQAIKEIFLEHTPANTSPPVRKYIEGTLPTSKRLTQIEWARQTWHPLSSITESPWCFRRVLCSTFKLLFSSSLLCRKNAFSVEFPARLLVRLLPGKPRDSSFTFSEIYHSKCHLIRLIWASNFPDREICFQQNLDESCSTRIPD